MNFLIIVGIIFGFLLARFFSGKNEGEQGILKSIKIKIAKYVVHLHHWLLFLIGLSILIALDYHNNLIYGMSNEIRHHQSISSH